MFVFVCIHACVCVLFAGPFCFDKMWFRCFWSVSSILSLSVFFFFCFVLYISLFHVFILHFDPFTRVRVCVCVLWSWMVMLLLLLLLSLLLFLLLPSSSFNNINGILATHIYNTHTHRSPQERHLSARETHTHVHIEQENLSPHSLIRFGCKSYIRPPK